MKDSDLILRTILESQKETIILSINKNYEYLYFNAAHKSIMKHAYNKEIEIGMNILKCISIEEDRLEAKNNYDRALKGESHSNIRVYGDINKAYFESFFNPIKNEQNEIIGITTLARDISQRKKSELALLEREKELLELNSTKDKILSIISHDLRSPIGSILGLSELLISNIDFSEKEECIKLINSSANHSLTLLDNLVNWVKSKDEISIFKPKKLILSEIIEDVVKFSSAVAKSKDIVLKYFSLDGIEVYADEILLKTVLRNLISNALKFTRPKGEIKVFASKKEEWVEVTVSDNGIGISKAKQKKLFLISNNNTTIGTANEKGSGLGLLLCKDIIEKQNGKLWVISTEGKGSEFKFTVPLYIY